MLMDVSKIAKKLKQENEQQTLKHKQVHKEFKQVYRQLLVNAKQIDVANNKELDNYLNEKIKASISQNVYTFTLDKKDFKDIYSILNVQEQLGQDLLKQYNKLHGSKFDLYNKVDKMLFKKMAKYINSNEHIHAIFMEVANKEYELTVYISL